MEQDEIEMSKEELQMWIREKVKKNKLISSDALQTRKLLQSMLEKREKQAVQLLKLCESVAACEAIVEKQYSLLGRKYTDDDDDDDDDNKTSCGSRVSISSTIKSSSPQLPKLQDSKNLCRAISMKDTCLKRKPVVVLSRLSESEISFFQSPTPEDPVSEDDSFVGSDKQWEPQGVSSDSDYSITSRNAGSNKRRRIDEKERATPQANRNSDAESKGTKTTTLKVCVKTDAKSNVGETMTPRGSANTTVQRKATKTSSPQASTNTDAKSNAPKTPKEMTNADAKSNPTKTQTSSTQTSGNSGAKSNAPKTSTLQTSASANPQGTNTTMNASASAVQPKKVTPWFKIKKDQPVVQKTELEVNMNVLARRKPMSWQHGKVIEIVTKEDGRVKYKIVFEDKGKCLVRAHHMAYEYRPKLDQLSVGSRVVVQPDPAQSRFCPGILGELPSRKNRMRFLVFMDDHSPVYVGLLLLNLVCKPLEDPLDDIPDGHHKEFLKMYLKAWPYPPQTQFRVGQSFNVEINGVLQRCEVQTVDCSLIQVVTADQHQDWIYRGSPCLEHVSSMKAPPSGKTKEGEKKDQK